MYKQGICNSTHLPSSYRLPSSVLSHAPAILRAADHYIQIHWPMIIPSKATPLQSVGAIDLSVRIINEEIGDRFLYFEWISASRPCTEPMPGGEVPTRYKVLKPKAIFEQKRPGQDKVLARGLVIERECAHQL